MPYYTASERREGNDKMVFNTFFFDKNFKFATSLVFLKKKYFISEKMYTVMGFWNDIVPNRSWE